MFILSPRWNSDFCFLVTVFLFSSPKTHIFGCVILTTYNFKWSNLKNGNTLNSPGNLLRCVADRHQDSSCSIKCQDYIQAFLHWDASIFFLVFCCFRLELYLNGSFQDTPFMSFFQFPWVWGQLEFYSLLPEPFVALLPPSGFAFLFYFRLPPLMLIQEQLSVTPPLFLSPGCSVSAARHGWWLRLSFVLHLQPCPSSHAALALGVMAADSVTPLGLHYPGMQNRESACLASENEHASAEKYEAAVERGLRTSGLSAVQIALFCH